MTLQNDRRTIYQGIKFDIAVETVYLPDGSKAQKEIVVHPGAAVMLAFVDCERICMVKNIRQAVGQTLLELPAGTLDPGETPETTALRELEEETGFRASHYRKIAEFYPSPGILSELMHLFVMKDLQPGRHKLDVGEQLQPVVIPFKEGVQMAVNGHIKDAKTLIGLLLYEKLWGSEEN